MTAMLFIGTNAWAKPLTGATGAALQNRIDSIMKGTESDPVIVLTQKVYLGTQTIWVGTKDLTGDEGQYKSITLDLNGYGIEKSMSDSKTTYNMFVITHGELKVVNNGAAEALIELKGTGYYNSSVFFICGSYKSSRWNDAGDALVADSINTRDRGYFSHLEIGTGVTISIEEQGTGININNIFNGTSCNGFKLPTAASYSSLFLQSRESETSSWAASNNSFAFGVRVDVKGKIYANGIPGTSSKSYGIKVNGTVQSPSNLLSSTNTRINPAVISTVNYFYNYVANNGAIGSGATHQQDTIDAPFIRIYPSAYIYSRGTGDKSGAVYASGYAKWLIEGTCEGKTGVYISSGVVDFNNADISSNADTYTQPSGSGSANGGGSGIVVNSRGGSYSGDMDITISGDTRVAGTDGYAIEEIVNTKPTTQPNPDYDPADPSSGEPTITVKETKVENITINGGTIEGGNQGAIVVSEETKVASEDGTKKTEVVVYGGNVDGETQVGTTGNLNDLIPTTGYHTTEVVDPTTGNTTVVVSEGNPPLNKTLSQAVADYNAWIAAGATGDAPTAKIDEVINTTLAQDLKFKELELNSSNSQQLTIPAGKTLTVGRMVMGANAIIFIEPEAKLIIDGEQGIVAPVVTNLILRVREDKQGALLFNPAVSSNRQPYATIQLYTTAYQMDANNHVWHRFSSPIAEMTGMTYTMGGISTYGGAEFFTSISEWDYVNNQWSTPLPSVTQMKPFVMYDMTNNASTAGVRYNFKGRIQGTVTDVLELNSPSWNYYGNAYTGTMNIKAMFDNMANPNVEQTVYVWDNISGQYITVTYAEIETHTADIDTVAALKTLVFRLKPGASVAEGTVKLDYEKSVWDYVTKNGAFTPTPAPQRTISDLTSVRISVTAEDGSFDRVTLMERDSYSNEYESGADAHKLMNENHINFYAVTDIDQAVVATDNMVGTMLSLQTMDEVSYTMSFDKVNGEVYALRDNLTNAVVLMNEGATYNFMAQSNATLDGRFQIVSRQEMPTAVETVEETIAPKAIYTIMGQYVGETTDWNTLPAGVYVVDGVKIVK